MLPEYGEWKDGEVSGNFGVPILVSLRGKERVEIEVVVGDVEATTIELLAINKRE